MCVMHDNLTPKKWRGNTHTKGCARVTLSGKIFVGQNFRRAKFSSGKIFVGRNSRRAKFSSGEILVGRNSRRAKFSSGEIFVGRNFRRAKFCSLSEKFVTFARRKIPNLSYFMRTQYNLYISALSKNYSSGEIFVGRNFRRAKFSSGEIFVGRNFRRAKFSSGEIFVGRNYSSGEIFVGRNYSSGEIIRRAKLFVGRNYSSGEIFVTWRKIRHFRPTKLRPINTSTVFTQNLNYLVIIKKRLAMCVKADNNCLS